MTWAWIKILGFKRCMRSMKNGQRFIWKIHFSVECELLKSARAWILTGVSLLNTNLNYIISLEKFIVHFIAVDTKNYKISLPQTIQPLSLQHICTVLKNIHKKYIQLMCFSGFRRRSLVPHTHYASGCQDNRFLYL